MRTTGGSGGVVSTVGAGGSVPVGGERLRTGGRGVVAASSSSSEAIGAVSRAVLCRKCRQPDPPRRAAQAELACEALWRVCLRFLLLRTERLGIIIRAASGLSDAYDGPVERLQMSSDGQSWQDR